jgi:hypothetical protein
MDTPLHGSGQGSTSSAPIWIVLISSIIMDCFEDVATGMTMRTDVKQTKKITQWIDRYVDDTLIFTTIQEKKGKPANPATLGKQLQ